MRSVLVIICLLCSVHTVMAAVELGVRGYDPVLLEDVYQREGIVYVAIDDVLPAVGLSGHWNSIKHIYRIRTKRGWAEVSPASGYLKLGDVYYPIKDKPRFIDGRLRITDSFVQNQLAQLSGRNVYFRNLDPQMDSAPKQDQGTIDKIFSFLLQRKPQKENGPLIRAIAIDPGHGGLDTGVLGQEGVQEKNINLNLAKTLAKHIKMQAGIPVYLSRDGDYDLAMEKRFEAASKDDVDVWILLHAGASFSSAASGVNLFIRSFDLPHDESTEANVAADHSLMLAQDIARIAGNQHIKVNGIYRSSRLSLGQGELPTVLIEVGQLSDPQDVEKLQTEEYQNQLSAAVYAGIKAYATRIKEQEHGK